MCHNHSHFVGNLAGILVSSEMVSLQFGLAQDLTLETSTGLRYRLPSSVPLSVHVPLAVGLSVLEHLRTRELIGSRSYTMISAAMATITSQME